MTQAAPSALERNAVVENSSPPAAQRLDLRREMVVREFTSHYGIRADEIFFDDGSDEPYFGFEALSLLVNKLTDIPKISIVSTQIDPAVGLATACCEVTLSDDRTRMYSGSAFIGEALPSRGTVEGFPQALALAQTRALRTTLRAVGFDPVRAHEAQKNGGELSLQLSEDNPRNKKLAEAHLHGDALGLIAGTDKSKWRDFISTWTHGVADSAGDLDDTSLGLLVVYLRSLRNARERGESEPGNASATGVGLANS
jgi:hypothetical protein